MEEISWVSSGQPCDQAGFFYSSHFTFIVPGGLTEIKMSFTREVAKVAAVKQNSDSNTATTCLLHHTPNDDL